MTKLEVFLDVEGFLNQLEGNFTEKMTAEFAEPYVSKSKPAV